MVNSLELFDKYIPYEDNDTVVVGPSKTLWFDYNDTVKLHRINPTTSCFTCFSIESKPTFCYKLTLDNNYDFIFNSEGFVMADRRSQWVIFTGSKSKDFCVPNLQGYFSHLSTPKENSKENCCLGHCSSEVLFSLKTQGLIEYMKITLLN